MPNGWEEKAALARAGIRRTTAGFQERRGDGGRKEPKYPPLPEPIKPPEPPSVWEAYLESLQKGWPWQREDPALEDWRRRVREEQALDAERKRLLAPPPTTLTEADIAFAESVEAMYGFDLPPEWREQAYKPPRFYEQQLRDWRERYEAGELIMLPEVPLDKLSPEWQEWYQETLRATGQQFYRPSEETIEELWPEVKQYWYQPLPTDFETMSDDEKEVWLNENAQASEFVDENGNIISYQEAKRLAEVAPSLPMKRVWLLSSGEKIETDVFPAGDLPTREEPPEMTLRKRGILEGDMTYKEKQQALYDLYGETTGQALDERTRHRLKQEVWLSLSQEEQDEAVNKGKKSERIGELKHELSLLLGVDDEDELMRLIRLGEEYGTSDAQEIARLAQMLPERWRPTEPVNIGELRGALAPYGVNIIENYPYISPITEAHLTRIPVNILEQMARYLKERGLSWQDFLGVSSSFYGQPTPARVGWAIPQQW